jgi:alpha-mannosidase
MTPGNKPYVVHIISHSHWDREWYKTQQQFRFALVPMIDQVLKSIQEDPEFGSFLLDGQSILIEDYLSLRPDKIEEVKARIAQKKVFTGPWYTQPDEFLVSPESLVRNLQIGIQTAQSFGHSLQVCWIPDSFGHIAQLPQILQGFGIETAVFSRGIGDQLPHREIEFLWKSPNGSQVVVLHQRQGYFSGGYLAFPFFWGDVREYSPSLELAETRVKQLLSSIREDAFTNHLVIWNGADHMAPEPGLSATIQHLNRVSEDYHFQSSDLETLAHQVRNSIDRLPVVQGELRGSRYHALLYSILSTRVYLKQRNYRLQRYLERYAEPLATLALIHSTQTLRSAHSPQLSFNYPNNELLEAWKILLQNHGHDSIGGCSIDQVHREMITRFDQSEQIAQEVVKESFHYLSQAVNLQFLPQRVPGFITFHPLDRPKDQVVIHEFRCPKILETPLVIFDSHSRAYLAQVLNQQEKVYGWLHQRTSKKELLENLSWWQEVLIRLDNLVIDDYKLLIYDKKRVTITFLLGDFFNRTTDRVIQSLTKDLEEVDPTTTLEITTLYVTYQIASLLPLSALGLNTFGIVEKKNLEVTFTKKKSVTSLQFNQNHVEESEQSVRIVTDQGNPKLCFAGGILEVNNNGSFTLTAKNGWVYSNLGALWDQGDRGDSYDFSPLGDEVSLDPVEPPDIRILHSGPWIATLELSYVVHIPEGSIDDLKERSKYLNEIAISTQVTIRAGESVVRITTRIKNSAKDHRVRAVFPFLSNQQVNDPKVLQDSPVILAESSYSIEKRFQEPEQPTDSPQDSWAQSSSKLSPHQHWVGLGNSFSALVVFTQGLHEHELIQTSLGSAIALTLFRSIGWLSRGDVSTREGQAGPHIKTPDAQCEGELTLEYGFQILPNLHTLNKHIPEFSGVFLDPITKPIQNLGEENDQFSLANNHRNSHSEPGFDPNVTINLEGSDFILTSIYKAKTLSNRIIVRFYNSRDVKIQQSIQLASQFLGCSRVKLNEDLIHEVPIYHGVISLEAEPYEIITLLLTHG